MAAWAEGSWALGSWAGTAWAGMGAGEVVEASDETYVGGFWHAFDRAQARRRKRRRELDELEDQVQAIKSDTDREIAKFLGVQERKDAERQDIERLRNLAERYANEQAERLFGERVAKAMARAAVQGNFSAIEAFEREVKRAKEEEEFLLQATIMVIELT